MYLLPAAPRTSNKWGMGRIGYTSSSDQAWRMRGLGRMGLQPVRLPNLGRLGQSTGAECLYYADDGVTVEFVDPESNQTECGSTGGRWIGPAAIGTPSPMPAQNPSPVYGGASNAAITTVNAGKPSSSPLDYISPQAAIAAGLDAQTVYNAWSAALSRFPSPQAAIAAGVPAGIVNQLWQPAHVTAMDKASSIFSGISGTTVALVGGGVLLLSLIGKRRR
jgi:hypothetical protein